MDINATMAELAEYIRLGEEVAANIEALKDQLKAYMQATGTDTISGAEHKAAYKSVTSNRLDTAALKRDLPDVAQQYTRATETRRFTFA